MRTVIHKVNPVQEKPPFEEIYETHYDAVWRFQLHAAADVHTALDLTSRTFFRAIVAWPRYKITDVPVEAWLIRIAVNEWRRELKRRKLSRFIPLISSEVDEKSYVHLDSHEVNAAVDALERDESYLQLRKSVAELPEKYETPILLYYFEHLSLEEVATVLGRPVGTVKSLIHRGIARLRQDQGLREGLGLSFSEAKS
jgi:RNA polymerase sigma factor (sigma-70 family)